jgi:hypothetical protein
MAGHLLNKCACPGRFSHGLHGADKRSVAMKQHRMLNDGDLLHGVLFPIGL